ncbi:hypothetical protein HH213_19950 [Duganella dendranthematis]|uniref:DUF3016 domain-containing protein n=1 Tax=Duganella dendranthematis TaxID=2728021 RepID=A0ABX6MDX1_9BURK|nr:hypothetical protein [Duganella dendranthematis]QJD92164.1 hypothetical protein HH213_19950 [Duganella dendranthematis]
MKMKLFSLSALVLCTSVAVNAAESGDVSTMAVAKGFVGALQHQRFRDAASMFAPGEVGDIEIIEQNLRKIDDRLGGFSTIRPIATLPDGKSVKLEIASHRSPASRVQKFIQIRYASTASDGQPVFYELNLAPNSTLPQILSLGVHFLSEDARSSKHANQIVAAFND